MEKSARNPVQAALRDDWIGPAYWGKTGDYEKRTLIELDSVTTEKIMAVSRELTGA